MVVPGFIFISELACPFSLSPWISNPDKTEPINIFDLLYSISMVEKYAWVAHAFFEIIIVIFDSIGTANQKSLLMISFQIFPKLSAFNSLSRFGCSKMILFTHASRQVYKCFIHLPTIQHLIGSMQLGVGFFHQWHPKFSDVMATAVQGCLALSVVGDSCVNYDVLPATVFEKLEDSEAVFNAIIDDEII